MTEAGVAAIAAAVREGAFTVSLHGIREMGAENIDVIDLVAARTFVPLVVVEDYPTDPRGASALLLSS